MELFFRHVHEVLRGLKKYFTQAFRLVSIDDTVTRSRYGKAAHATCVRSIEETFLSLSCSQLSSVKSNAIVV